MNRRVEPTRTPSPSSTTSRRNGDEIMITLPRAAIARFSAIVRKSLRRTMAATPVTVRSGSRSLGLETVTPDFGIRLIVPGRGAAESIVLNAEALSAIAGSSGDVALNTVDRGQLVAAWDHGGRAKQQQFPAVALELVRPFPNVP